MIANGVSEQIQDAVYQNITDWTRFTIIITITIVINKLAILID